MKIVINPTYEHLRTWIEQLSDTFEQQGEVIYSKRNETRRMTTPDGHQVCVKRFHTPCLWNRIGYTFFRAPKAQRAYENALVLLERGIATPQPIGYILCGENLLQESYLITAYSPLTRNFYEFGNGVIAGKEDIIRAFARYTAAAHEAGIYHLDYSPGNILFDKVNGAWQFEMIDINRMQTHTVVGWRKGSSNFARLWGKADLHRLIAEEYAQARHFDPERCSKIALQARKRFWRRRPHPFFVYD
jgi:hypothetical protein